MPHELALTPEEKEERKRDFNRLRQQRHKAKKRAAQAQQLEHQGIPPLDTIGKSPDDALADLLPAPVIDPHVANLNEKHLSFYAAAEENTLPAIAAALGVTQESIIEFVKVNYSLTWAEYQRQKVRAAKARALAHLTGRASLGDIRSLEALNAAKEALDPHSLSAEDWQAVYQARRLRAMTITDLETEAARLRATLSTTASRLALLLARAPSVHVISDAAASEGLPVTDDIEEVLPKEFIPLDEASPKEPEKEPAHRSAANTSPTPVSKVTVTQTDDMPPVSPTDIELDEVLTPEGARDSGLDRPVGALRDACAASRGAGDGNAGNRTPATFGPPAPSTNAVIYTPPALELKSGPGTDGMAGLMSDIVTR